MVRFKGRYRKNTQQKCIKKALLSKQASVKDNVSSYVDLTELIREKGVLINIQDDYEREKHDNIWTINESYHFNGVSIGIRRVQHDKYRNHEVRNATRVRLVAENKDSLDDIVEMILDKFPSFKEVDFDYVV